METDREILIWLHERLTKVHGENELFDYMHRFRAIISTIPKDQCTRSKFGCNSLIALQEKFAKAGVRREQQFDQNQ